MADVTLNITIPDAKVADATIGFLKIYPNVELVDPNDSESGLKYTTKNWVEEKLRRVLIKDCNRGLNMISNAAAVIATDNDMATVSQ